MHTKKIKEILSRAKREISSLDAEILLEMATGISREKLFSNPEKTLSDKVSENFFNLVEKRKNTPLAYLSQKKEFFTREFFVNKNVLIPRPETEILVEEVIKDFTGGSILEVGTGSGVISTTLKLEIPNLGIAASDISGKALRVAKKNAKNLEAEVVFFKSNLLSFFRPTLSFASFLSFATSPVAFLFNLVRNRKMEYNFEIIVANLPYVISREITGQIKEEPKIALDGGLDGFDLYRRLFKEIAGNLKKLNTKKIFCEIDPRQKNILSMEVEKYFPGAKVKFTKDLSGKIRVAKIFL